jgi:hypothetical protein
VPVRRDRQSSNIGRTNVTAVLNGQRRPSLNDQIVRLDRILDGLAEGLNESVTSAVQGAVTNAVKEATIIVLREMFSNAAALPTLAAAMTPPPAKPPLLQRVGHGVRRLWRKAVSVVKALPATARRAVVAIGSGIRRMVSAACRTTINRITGTAAAIAGMFLIAWRLRRSVPIAVTAGLGAAALGYTATPVLAAVLHGVTIATLALMARLLTPAPLPRFVPRKS